MAFDPRVQTLGTYKPREFRIECLRCRRGVVLDRWHMVRRFGTETTLADCAGKIAASAGCNLAAIYGGPDCSVQVFETSVESWATLRDAQEGKWRAYLTCQRRYAALKSAESCPGTVALDIATLIVALGDQFPLLRLKSRSKCPSCGTSSVAIDWQVPQPPSAPAPIQEKPPELLRLRPRGAALARTRLQVVKDD